MLNYFWWYSAIWFSVIVLYLLGWSDFNRPLDPSLLLFLFSTSIVSLIIGYIFRKRFKFSVDKSVNVNIMPIIALAIAVLIELFVAGHVPLFSILLHTREYGNFDSIPFLHVAIISLSLYYYAKSFYCVVCGTERKKHIIICMILLFFFALYFFRACFIICGFVSANILLAYLKYKKKIKPKSIVISVIAALLLLYLFGGVGNVRQGVSWNDNTLIERIGLYNEKYPSIIPKQYMWAYSYITSPLANLNDNILLDNRTDDDALIKEVLPTAITKRLADPTQSEVKPYLEREYFNAVTGWCSIYMRAGLPGMYLLFCVLMGMGLIGVNKRFVKRKGYVIYFIIFSVVVAFMFFYNTIAYVATSIPMWICLIWILFGEKFNAIIKRKR